ncbi:MAG: DNA methyltransferase [Chloroflexota bacterium]
MADAIRQSLNVPGVVLDPFAGVGTTLVEAILRGHDAIGFEINPYAALSCRVKCQAHLIDRNNLESEVTRFRKFFNQRVCSNYKPMATPPHGFKTRSAFFSPSVLKKVLIFQDFVDTIAAPDTRDLFKLAFGSTMVQYSNYSYEPSLGRRASVGKPDIDDSPVDHAIMAKLAQMIEDIAWLQSRVPTRMSTSQVFNESFLTRNDLVPSGSVDLIVTSPPYLNNYHYNRNTRPQLYWLGYKRDAGAFRSLEVANFGKYWQTVRELDRVDLDFSLPDLDLAETLERLRSLNPEKGIYGGRGWANYAASYFNDCYRFALSAARVLRPGGRALIVIGNSILQGVAIATDQYLGEIGRSVGLELLGITIPRATRVGNSILGSSARASPVKGAYGLYEAVVELRKLPSNLS